MAAPFSLYHKTCAFTQHLYKLVNVRRTLCRVRKGSSEENSCKLQQQAFAFEQSARVLLKKFTFCP